jgi:hypothetical protein
VRTVSLGRVGVSIGTVGAIESGGLCGWNTNRLPGWRWVVLGSRWPGHVQTRGTAECPGQLRRLGQGFLWGWSAERLNHGERVGLKDWQVGYFQDWEGHLERLGQGSLAGFPEPQQAVAHLGQVRHLGQGFLAEVCWCARRVCPGRGDQASLLLCSRMALPSCGGVFDMAEKWR